MKHKHVAWAPTTATADLETEPYIITIPDPTITTDTEISNATEIPTTTDTPNTIILGGGDKLEKLLPLHSTVLEALSPDGQKNVMYNFFNSETGMKWLNEQGITDPNKIFEGKVIDMTGLDDLLKNMEIKGESIVERAARLFPKS